MNRQRLFPLLAVLSFFAAVQPLAADTVVSATVGRTFSGDVEEGHTSYGAAIGFLGEGIFGFEVEGTYTPHFFGPDNSAGTSNVTTLMGNIVLGVPIGGNNSRIYATGGVGLMKFRVPDADAFFDIDRNDFGMNAGAGVMVGLSDRFGVRGDVRYFRDIRQSTSGNDFDVDLGGFHYWRGAVGVTLKF
jgi:opacity protein-like surface antigen